MFTLHSTVPITFLLQQERGPPGPTQARVPRGPQVAKPDGRCVEPARVFWIFAATSRSRLRVCRRR